MYVKRVHTKVLANANRWIWIGLNFDKHVLEQHRGKDVWYLFPNWDTVQDSEPVENPFSQEDIYEENAVSRLDITNIRIRCTSIQERVMAKTFRGQMNLLSTGFEIGPRNYL